MKYVVGKKYRCTHPLNGMHNGVYGRQVVEGCKNSIVTIQEIRSNSALTVETHWWVYLKFLKPVYTEIKYNKDLK